MSAFKNVSIRLKIFAAFAAMVLLIGGFGAYALVQASKLHDSTSEISDNWLPSISGAGEVRFETVRHRTAVAFHGMVDRDDLKAEAEKSIATVTDSLQKARANYGKRISSDEERRLYREYSGNWTKYQAAVEEMIALSRKHEDQAATEVYSTKIRMVARANEEIVDKIVKINLAGAHEADVRADNNYDTSKLVTWIVVGLAIMLAAVSGFFLARSVATPVIGMTEAMGRLAAKDMSVEIPAVGQADEIGKMANAVQVFKENMIKADAAAKREAEELKAREARTKAINQLTNDFDADVSLVLKTVASATTEMQATASSMTATAEETSRQSTAVAAAAEEASTNVQTVASAAEELSSSISEISRQVSQSARISAQAVEQANKTNAQVESLAEGRRRSATW